MPSSCQQEFALACRLSGENLRTAFHSKLHMTGDNQCWYWQSQQLHPFHRIDCRNLQSALLGYGCNIDNLHKWYLQNCEVHKPVGKRFEDSCFGYKCHCHSCEWPYLVHPIFGLGGPHSCSGRILSKYGYLVAFADFWSLRNQPDKFLSILNSMSPIWDDGQRKSGSVTRVSPP